MQSGRIVFEKDELEVPVEMDYSGYKSGGLKVPGLDSAHVRHRLSPKYACLEELAQALCIISCHTDM